jgi:hypothetical protein
MLILRTVRVPLGDDVGPYGRQSVCRQLCLASGAEKPNAQPRKFGQVERAKLAQLQPQRESKSSFAVVAPHLQPGVSAFPSCFGESFEVASLHTGDVWRENVKGAVTVLAHESLNHQNGMAST